MSLLDKLTALPDHEGELCLYTRENMQAAVTHVIDLAHGALLAVLEGEGESTWTEFAVFEWNSGPSTVDGVECGPAMYAVVFCGAGPSGYLRELRHTYWGEDGYLHHLPAAVIADAFAKLQRWFDCGVTVSTSPMSAKIEAATSLHALRSPQSPNSFVLVIDIAQMTDLEFHVCVDRVLLLPESLAGLLKYNVYSAPRDEIFDQLDKLSVE